MLGSPQPKTVPDTHSPSKALGLPTMVYHCLSQQAKNHRHHYHHCKCCPVHHRNLYQIFQKPVESKTPKRQTQKAIGPSFQKKDFREEVKILAVQFHQKRKR